MSTPSDIALASLADGLMPKPVELQNGTRTITGQEIVANARALRWQIDGDFHQELMEAIYTDAANIADRAVTRPGEKPKFDLDRTIDRLVTSRVWGFPLMILLFTVVFWITITGANIPSQMIADVLIGRIYPWLQQTADALHVPWWLSGLLIDGMYLASAWVVSVMLPPMAIFFPLFTLLEDLGYLPRVAFNLDNIFKKAGAHGKQSLSMMMGFGCNAAGVVATRIIDSPRERLIAILTNNFALCNGRWPTQILIASLFIGALAPAYLAGLVSALAVVGVAMLGVVLSFALSWGFTGQFSRARSPPSVWNCRPIDRRVCCKRSTPRPSTAPSTSCGVRWSLPRRPAR